MSSYEHDPRLRAMTWDRVVAAIDEEFRTDYTRTGYPKSRHDLPSVFSQFWPMREEWYRVEGVPYTSTTSCGST